MTCNYPLCRAKALWTPVIELPTIRTVGETSEMVQTDRPTVLLGREVCEQHMKTYNLTDWLPDSDWAYIQEAARANGYLVPEPKLLVIQFRPIGWQPKRHLEVER